MRSFLFVTLGFWEGLFEQNVLWLQKFENHQLSQVSIFSLEVFQTGEFFFFFFFSQILFKSSSFYV